MATRTARPASRPVQLRIRLLEPLSGCAHALQHGAAAQARPDQVQLPAPGSTELCFELQVEMQRTADGSLDARGPFVQGPRCARFVYVCSGTLAGQAGSPWTRRAKVPLQGLAELLQDSVDDPAAWRGEATIAGRARDGGPACASVVLLDGGWRLLPAVP